MSDEQAIRAAEKVLELALELQGWHQENARGNCTEGCGVWRCTNRYIADELEDAARVLLAAVSPTAARAARPA